MVIHIYNKDSTTVIIYIDGIATALYYTVKEHKTVCECI